MPGVRAASNVLHASGGGSWRRRLAVSTAAVFARVCEVPETGQHTRWSSCPVVRAAGSGVLGASSERGLAPVPWTQVLKVREEKGVTGCVCCAEPQHASAKQGAHGSAPQRQGSQLT